MFVCLNFTISSNFSLIISLFFQLTRTIYTLYCLRVIPQGKRARRPIAEVNPNPAGLELGWVTDKKYPLLYAIFFVCLIPFYFSFPSFFLSLLFLRTKLLVDIFIITIFYFFFNFITKNIGSAGSGGSAGSAGSAVCSSAD